jgi:CelD/BcsL family acetyltransferase involved in cellulose biosynthesis
VHVDVVRPDELGVTELDRWAGIQLGDESLHSPFLSPGFTLAVAEVRPATRVAVMSGDGGTAGFLPFEQGGRGNGLAVGMGLSDVQGLIASARFDPDLDLALRASGLRLFRFDHWLASQERWLSSLPSRLVPETSPALDLSAGFEHYLSQQQASSKSFLQSTARKRRKLQREHGPVRLVLHEPDHRLLDEVLAWKSSQYRRTGRRDRFADDRNRALAHSLLEVDDATFGGMLSVLYAGDSMVAAHFGLRSRRTVAWWFPVYDTTFAAYSPGLILVLDLARAMVERQLSLLDLGKGDEAYKDRLSNTRLQLLRGSVARSPLRQAVHTARQWPGDRLMQLVLDSPRLRRVSREALARMGELRERLPRQRS